MNMNKAVERFVAHLGAKSPNTIKTYLSGTQRFMECLTEKQGIELPEDQWNRVVVVRGAMEKTDVAALTTDDVIDFANWLKERGLAQSSINAYLAAVMQFFLFLMFRRENTFTGDDYMLLQKELASRRGKRGSQRKLPKLPPTETVETLIETAHQRDDDDPRLHLLRLRDRAATGTLRQTACRIAELASMKRQDLIPEHRAARITGKGDKERVVYLWEAWDDVQAYLKARDTYSLELIEDQEPVFAAHDLATWHQQKLRSVGTAALRNALALLCKAAGVPRTKPHSLRHYRATEVQQQTGNIVTTQKMLGHADISTTGIYVHLAEDELYQTLKGLKEEEA